MKVSSGTQMRVTGKKFDLKGSTSSKDSTSKSISGTTVCKIKHGPKDTCISCCLNISAYIDLTMDSDDRAIPTGILDPTVDVKMDDVPKSDIKSATKSDIHADLESDNESDIEFDLNPDIKMDSEPEIESNKYPKCDPGSSTIPFSLDTRKVFETWTDPHPASGKRRNNCTILLDKSSEERTAVVDNFLQSFREGSQKLEYETSRFMDSAAGDVLYSFSYEYFYQSFISIPFRKQFTI
jgi:hypothetical protein